MPPRGNRWPAFVGAVAVLVVAYSMVYGAVSTARTNEQLVAAATEDNRADAERDAKAQAQRDQMQDMVWDLRQQVTNLVGYFARRGIPIPEWVLTASTRDDPGGDNDDGDDSDDSGDTRSGGASPAPKARPSARPSPTQTTPAAAGLTDLVEDTVEGAAKTVEGTVEDLTDRTAPTSRPSPTEDRNLIGDLLDGG